MAERGEKEEKREKAEGESPEKPKASLASSGLVRVLVGVAIVLVILALVFLATYYFTHYWRTTTIIDTEPFGPGQGDEVQDPPLAFEMGQFTVIIFDENNRSYNLRVSVFLTVNPKRPEKAEVTMELDQRKRQLTDGIYEVLIAMDPKSFMGSPLERSEGMAELKAAITRAVNSRMKNKIDGVLLTEFIFQ